MINKNMKIGEIVSKYPETVEVFMKHGLHCIGCAMSGQESLEDGAKAHGIDLKKLLKDLNDAVSKGKKSKKV